MLQTCGQACGRKRTRFFALICSSFSRAPLSPPSSRRTAGHDAGGLRERAFAAARSGNAPLASELFREYLQKPGAEHDVAALNACGAMQAQLGRLELAVDYFQQALAAGASGAEEGKEAKEARANTFFNLGNACAALSLHQDAREAFEQALKLRPTDAQALTNLGNAHSSLGDLSAALAAYERAVDADASPIALVNCGNALCDQGRNNEGVMMLLEAVDAGAVPDLELCLNIGVAARRAGMTEISMEYLQEVLSLDASNVLARRLLRTLDEAASHETGTVEEDAAYARMLFDADVDEYEVAMRKDLKYQAPNRLLRLVLDASSDKEPKARAIDLGCGSGLMGDLLRAHCSHLIGVDIAPAMVSAARTRRLPSEEGREGGLVYDEVKECEVGQALRDEAAGGVDLVIAADVLCYISDLQPLMAAASHALAPQGLLAFSCEALMDAETRPGVDFCLRDTGRYAHGEEYVRRTAEAVGLELRSVDQGDLRMNNGQWISGLFWLFGPKT